MTTKKIPNWQVKRGKAMISALSLTAQQALEDIAIIENYIYGKSESIAARLSAEIANYHMLTGNDEINSLTVLELARKKRANETYEEQVDRIRVSSGMLPKYSK
jgi:Ser/Thr protein kinase RdoA (MazF antagonist)